MDNYTIEEIRAMDPKTLAEVNQTLYRGLAKQILIRIGVVVSIHFIAHLIEKRMK